VLLLYTCIFEKSRCKCTLLCISAAIESVSLSLKAIPIFQFIGAVSIIGGMILKLRYSTENKKSALSEKSGFKKSFNKDQLKTKKVICMPQSP